MTIKKPDIVKQIFGLGLLPPVSPDLRIIKSEGWGNKWIYILMSEMAHAGEDHGDAIFITGINGILIFLGTAGLDNGFNPCLGSFQDGIIVREVGITG